MVIIAHNIRSLHNVGAIFRSADVFGVQRVYLTGYTGQPPRKEISKTALGSQLRVPWEQSEDIDGLISKLKASHQLVALEYTKDSVAINDLKAQKPIALLLGSEVEGVDKELLKQMDDVVHIPMIGTKSSLNVSVATGIALFALAPFSR